MTLLLLDGVDDGLSGYKWTSGAARDTGRARTGAASLLVGTSSGTGGFPSYTLNVADRNATMIMGAGVYFVGNVVDYDIYNFAGSAGATHIAIRRKTTGAVEIVQGSTGTVATTGPNVMLAGNWYHLEAKVLVADGGGTVDVRVNGVSVVTFSGDTRNGGADANVYSVSLSAGSGAPDRQASVDDFFLLNGAGSYNNNLIGDCKVITLYPNGNGNYSQGVGSDADSVNNYLLVDENGVPNTSDYIDLANTGDKDSYAFDNLPAGTIYGIAQRAYASKTDAGSRTMRNFQRIGGVDYPSATDQGLSVTPTYLGLSDIVEKSPATSAAWTVTEINGTEFGVEARP